MPIVRDPRMDRRRRMLRDNANSEGSQESGNRRRRGNPKQADEDDGPRRGAGYSHEVRRACGQRLVQLIPVRKRSFLLAIFASLLVPAGLLVSHYMIYVSGSLPWYGHPLAVSLDASHPSSIAAWFSSHIWLLCLGATILTFQLRRHKLDDYDGEYRLWFWLVATCLLASIDATTRITDLFGLALDRWSQINLGWSGPAVVQATLAVLIGMLGLRLCTELKQVPTSLIFWLVGLVCWAGSAALAQEELQLSYSLQFRIWLKAALWLSGLTAVWLAALAYLRHVYMEAQQRFLLRSQLAGGSGQPLGQRIRAAMPRMPGSRNSDESDQADSGGGWRLFRRQAAEPQTDSAKPESKRRSSKARSETTAERQKQETRKQQTNSPSQGGKPKSTSDTKSRGPDARSENNESEERRGLGGFFKRSKPDSDDGDKSDSSKDRDVDKPKSRLTGWLRKPKDSDEPEEYRKVKRSHKPEPTTASKSKQKATNDDEDGESKPGWMSKLKAPKLPKIAKPNVKGFFSKFKLPSLRLPPPTDSEDDDGGIRRVDSGASLPGTDSSSSEGNEDESGRHLSKAERKRLRRQQRRAA